MISPITLKDAAREANLLRSRVAFAGLLVVLLTVILLARLVKLQILDHAHFQTLSDENRVKIVPVPPTRGLILDRNGVVLARNVPAYSLDIIPEAVADLDQLLIELRDVIDIREADEQRFRRLLKRKRRFDNLSLRFQLSEDEVARFAVNRHRFPGADVNARLARNYPLGPLAAHVIGYVGRPSEADLQRLDSKNYRGTAHVGKTGVERAYESLLHGSVGYEHVETNALGRILRVLERVAPDPGRNLYLSVDASLQAVAEAQLGDERGSVVAIDPDSGAILAMASMPSFDPNMFVNGLDSAKFLQLTSSPGRPLFNRALAGQYPPGSTVKPFIGLAGLERDLELARGEIWCSGAYKLKGHARPYRDWKEQGHGAVNLRRGIAESCDVYFYQLALALGIDRMHQFLSRFGFGVRTGLKLAGEARGLMPSSNWKRRARNEPWFPGETLITGIGQGYFLVTPLQLASATATLGARGLRLQPRIVERVEDQISGEISLVPSKSLKAVRLRNKNNWEQVVAAMEDVVHGGRGTARRVSRGIEYRMAGKTGTAQVISIAEDEEYEEDKIAKAFRDHALFVAFAPAAGPRIAVAIVVENAGSGSKTAAPIARKVIDHFLVRQRPGRENDDFVQASYHPGGDVW
ncbi:MAG: penicillin-binding protein 2 [Gammaproteobacteria bacterium]|nr:MAG: penicillin-binding protein 2 [Gammaproteobacteria bacterium]